MSRPNFTEIQAKEDSVNRLQKNIKSALSPILSLPFSAGVHKTEVSIGTSDTIVDHGLDRNLVGYFVTKQNADTNVFVSTTSNTLPTRQVILKAGSAVTADLFFF